MPTPPPYRTASTDEVTEAIAAVLRGGGGVPREVSCFLAMTAAAHLADRLAVSGFVVMLPDLQPRLEV